LDYTVYTGGWAAFTKLVAARNICASSVVCRSGADDALDRVANFEEAKAQFQKLIMLLL
jgi:hypothetical protein